MLHISRILKIKLHYLHPPIADRVHEDEISRILKELFPRSSPDFFSRGDTLFLKFKNPAHSGNFYYEQARILRALNRSLTVRSISRIQILT